MSLSIGSVGGINHVYAIGGVGRAEARRNTVPESVAAARDLPSVPLNANSGLRVLYSADGDSAELLAAEPFSGLANMEIPLPQAGLSDALPVPDIYELLGHGTVIYNADGDSAEFEPVQMAAEFDASALAEAGGTGECTTCSSRRYVDGSDDSSVSYQTPTRLNPSTAAAAVAAHENEHVRHERSKAARSGRMIVNQTVTLKYDACPECGRHYVAGGVTRTISANKPDTKLQFKPAEESKANGQQ